MPALVQETGQGLSNANSYVSVAYADAYFDGISEWTAASIEARTAALIVGFDSVEQLYGPNYLGSIRPTSQQAALFPRLAFTDNNGRLVNANTIPACLLRAQCEVALMHLKGVDAFPQKNAAQFVTSESVTLGALTESKSYGRAVESESYPGFRKVDLMLAPILNVGKDRPAFLAL